jgi:hypothetical protein
MSERIILSELDEHQKTIIAETLHSVQVAQRQFEAAKALYNRMVRLAMPKGATGFDFETATFYYEEPEPPVLVEEAPEGDEGD